MTIPQMLLTGIGSIFMSMAAGSIYMAIESKRDNMKWFMFSVACAFCMSFTLLKLAVISNVIL